MAFGWLKNAFTKAAQEPWEIDRDDFFKAIKRNNVEKIREIAARYPNEALGWKTENGTPLYVAHENNRLEAFKALVELGADINEAYTFGKGKGRTPLLRSIERKQTEWVEYIASNGADLNKKQGSSTLIVSSVIYSVYTPLSLAIDMGDEQMVKLLIAKGVDPAAPCFGAAIDKDPELKVSPATHAEHQKQYKMADMLKRMALQAATSANVPAPAPVAPIGVMQPLRLKKQQDATP